MPDRVWWAKYFFAGLILILECKGGPVSHRAQEVLVEYMIKNANLSHMRPVATAAEYVFEALAIQQARRACARRYWARVEPPRCAGARKW